MTYIALSLAVVALLSVAFGLRCYWELWRWARQCQRAQIAIAFKRKVQLSAPLVEWLLWCNQLDIEKDANGRVIYRNGGVSVAIIRGRTSAKRSILRSLKLGLHKTGRTSTPPVRMGTYEAKDDKTGRRVVAK